MSKLTFLLSIALIFSINLVNGQILTLQNNGNVPGDVKSIRRADTTDIIQGASGLNVTWDFSKLVIGLDIQTVTYLNPKTTPYADTFPAATVATADNGTYYYFKCDSTEYISLGVASTQSILKYSEPLVNMKYPFSYGSNFMDSTFNAINGMTVKQHTIITADGKGTLILAGKTFYNILRVKTVTHSIDSSQFLISIFDYEDYTWYDGINKTALLVVSFTKMKSSIGFDLNSKSVSVSNDIISGIDENLILSKNELEIYPNPASDIIFIETSNKNIRELIYEISDMQGRLIKRGTTLTGTININSLENGLYSVLVRTGSNVFIKRVIKN